ncbi:phytanoyl-CoA dioxygenase family protein [Paraburkholderia nemoris]|uniref:phytanoyl-CoA dioxygenase family protein n=1 Tax=Paraburkholderia nemoris TaxID=2793076 RepID=UPI0038B9336B
MTDFNVNDPSSRRTMVDLSSLQRDGYLVLRNALSSEACDSISTVLFGLPFEERKQFGMRFSRNCLTHCPDVGRHFVVSGALSGVRPEDALYDEVVEFSGSYDGSYPWHQDAAYFPEAVVSISLALSPIKTDHGCFTVVPGSHAAGLLPYDDTKNGIKAADVSESRALLLELERGDIVLNHSLLIHRIAANLSKSPTRLYSIILGSAGGTH